MNGEMLSGRSGDEKKSINKEDDSNSWKQEVLHMLVAFTKYVYDVQYHNTICMGI